ncbi:mitochondrial ribosomal protein L40 [Calliopsis andreniformis]|uniref:mitochondrial ribosomal protein L40 n=1 Tax=Calliopsis andreniformis TaxID=337506 RepID=UPI003FCDBD7F
MIRILNVVNTFSRSSLRSGITNSRNVSTCLYPLYFRRTDVLTGEPLKKRKRLDPAIVKAREDRRKRKLEKYIRRLEKHAKQLKPIDESDISPQLMDQKEERSRPAVQLSEEEIERRALLQKEWCRYKQDQWLVDVHIIESMMLSQEKALKELKIVSKELYEKAVEFDKSFLPYNALGPVHTPPIDNYDSPDGEYINVTFKYEGET